MYNNTTHITVGVLLVDSGIQMADISSVDILAVASSECIASLFPKAAALAALATPMTVVYTSEDGASPLTITSTKIGITHSIQSAPKLDILVVPGPPPDYHATEAVKLFIKATNEAVAPSGVLDGKTGTGPIGMVPMMRELCPKVKWTDARRWERNVAEGSRGQVERSTASTELPPS